MTGGLAAISAIFGTAAGLDAQELAALYGVRIEMAPMHAMCAVEEIRERGIVDGLRLGERPSRAALQVARGRIRLAVFLHQTQKCPSTSNPLLGCGLCVTSE